MKKSKMLLVLVFTFFVGLMCSSSCFAAGEHSLSYTAGTGITGTPHDMTAFLANVGVTSSETRICAYCHTPHNANAVSGGYNPLWSRPDSVSSFTAYTNTVSFDGTLETDPATGPSRLCMSCHDGSIAVDTYYNFTGTKQLDGYGSDLGTDLSNDHPIGFNYDDIAVSVDAEIRASASATFSGGATVASVLFNGIMTCASCHDVHNGPSTAASNFLLGAQNASSLCLTCHIK